MNKQQLSITLKHLRGISEELLSAVSEKESVNKDLMILSANSELLDIIKTLTDHYATMREEL